MPTYIRPTEPQEGATDAEASAGFFTFVALADGFLTAVFVSVATGNYWWGAVTFFGLVTLASIIFAAAHIVAIPGEKFAQQMQKQQGPPSFALFVAPDQPPDPQASPPKPPNP